MLKVLLSIIIGVVAGSDQQSCLAAKQLICYKNNQTDRIERLTTEAGAPVERRETISTLNTDLLDNEHLIDMLKHVVRERIPDRVVHGGGAGAFGYFETTHDISHICKAKLFEVGRKTPVGVRFSLTFSPRGVSDLTRDLRGFAIKFYTKEGNFDIVGLNTPIFGFKEPLLFASLSHVIRKNPVTNLPDPNMLWDLMTLHPEILYSFMYLSSDRGTPNGYRHMPGFGIHTYQVYNEVGESYFVRFHFYPVAGIKNFTSTEAAKIASADPDYNARDLYNAIANGEYPSWKMSIQIIPLKDMKNSTVDYCDVTIDIPIEDYPLHPVGTLTLNENPVNYFAQVDQIAFCPGNLVPGIRGGCGVLFQSRSFAYKDAHDYRLKGNSKKIPVNCPKHSHAYTYNRDGDPPVTDNGGYSPNYIPNSFSGSVTYEDEKRPSLLKIHEKEPNNFEQAGNFYKNELSSKEQTSLVDNIVHSLCSCEEFIKKRAIHWFTVIDSGLGCGIAKGLAANCS